MKIPQEGLPDHLFKYVSSITPIINVDLIIHNPKKGILLSWRADNFYGPGWHVPGGIIRFKEKIRERLIKVGKTELNINISSFEGPIALNEIIINQKERSHFISILYKCKINRSELEKLFLRSKNNNKIAFFKKVPKYLLHWHKIYKKYI